MKRLLIVSPHFPPTNAPDAQRAITALPWMKELGWEAQVLAVDPAEVAAPVDERLGELIPPDIPITRCGAFPLRLSRRVGMQTLGWRAYRSLKKAGDRLMAQQRPDLVFFTTTQFMITSLGPYWRQRRGVPFAVDIQDPWVTDFYDKPGAPPPPGGWKYQVNRWLARRQERRTFAAAAGFVSVSADYLQQLSDRYRWFASRPQITIPFGVDGAAVHQAIASNSPAFSRGEYDLHLVSVGAVGPIMHDAIVALMRALAELKTVDEKLASRVNLHFYGTSYAEASAARATLPTIAKQFGVEAQVEEHPARLAWGQAMATLAAGDAMVVPTSRAAGYTPSKLASSFAVGRPALVITSPDSNAARITAALGLGSVLPVDAAGGDLLANFLRDVASDVPGWPNQRHEEKFEREFSAAARTRQLALFLEKVITSESCD